MYESFVIAKQKNPQYNGSLYHVFLPGYNDNQLMFSSQFFVDNPSVTSFHISLKATTVGQRIGTSHDSLQLVATSCGHNSFKN